MPKNAKEMFSKTIHNSTDVGHLQFIKLSNITITNIQRQFIVVAIY